MEIGKAFGLELVPLLDWYRTMYNAVAPTLSEAVKKNKAYAGVKGHSSMNTRYIYEDIPMGLVPLAALGKLAGKPVKRIETIIQLGEFLLHTNYSETGRNLKNLGLEGHSISEIQNYLESGSF
jgi:opine dehydrogenase